jgi:very-short-patch-repair endonuclease
MPKPKCACGKTASKFTSPLTRKKVCKPCLKLHLNAPAVVNQLELQKKAKKKAKAKNKYERKKKGLTNPCGGYEFDTPEFREKQKSLPARIKKLRDNATPAEKHINKLFEQAPYEVIFQKGFIAYEYYCIVDFYLPFYKVCLEIDGGYHLDPEQVSKDRRKDQYLTETRHCLVKRLTNEQALAITSFEQLNDFLELSEIEVETRFNRKY